MRTKEKVIKVRTFAFGDLLRCNLRCSLNVLISTSRFTPRLRLASHPNAKVLKVIRNLPANASIEDAMERLLFLAKIEKGLNQADAGETVPHDHVKEKMSKWLQ